MKTSRIFYIVVVLIGLMSMLLLYIKEDYCVFSDCISIVPNIDQPTKTQPKTDTTTPRELKNGAFGA